MSIETIQTGSESEDLFIPDGPDRSDPAVAEALRNQFRMTRMQLYDWGTFSGVCDIPISPRGYLILGPSGAGKSTILDAISALLVPPRVLDFNAASREAAKKGPDRNLLSYVRGAWAEQSDREAGGTAVQYLRKGTTWSAISITYESEAGKAVTLVQLFTLRGNSNSNSDVKRLCLIFERRLALTELEVFGQTNFDVRKLKQTFPDAHVRDEFLAYSERFCQLLGIESDRALKLLHKTQSAKALGDLDVFLREFMLDRPETFKAADDLVAEFGELNNAHQSVVTAREQAGALRPAHAAYASWQDLGVALGETVGLADAAEPYKKYMELILSNQERDALTLEIAGIRGVLTAQEADQRAQEQRQTELQQEFLQAGGSAVGQWRTEIARLDAERVECAKKRTRAEAACKGLGLTLPTSAEKFAELGAQAQREGDAWREGAGQEDQGPRDQLVQKRAGLAGQLATDSEELKSLRGRRSSIPMKLVNLRNEIARELQISEANLPFVGELIEVKPDEEAAGWRGAIERVLGGTATDLLVDDHNYRAVVAYVNGRNLGLRLTYHRVRGEQADTRSARAPQADSLIYKVNVDRGSPFAAWVQARLQDRFDFACVESVDAFRVHERAVTKEGQLKNGQRHEKDDRFAINDQSRWCLGFDNARKVAVFEERIEGYRRAMATIDEDLDKLARKQQERFAKVAHWGTLSILGWPDIDTESRATRIADLEDLVRDTESGDGALGEISRKLEAQKGIVTAAQRAVAVTGSRLTATGEKVDKLSRRIAELEDIVELGGVAEAQREALAERYAEIGEPVTLATLEKAAAEIKLNLAKERGRIETRQAELAGEVLAGFRTFREHWPAEAADLGLDMESASGYFAKLERLEADDLPRHEARFFQLLRDQSSQGLTALLQKITYAQANIQERMSRVNESLRRAEFNVGTYLQIEPKDRQLKEAVEFKQELQQARAPLTGDEEPEEAEARFAVLRALVTKLGSQDPALQRWRDAVLDVRQHFEFIGKELTLDDDSEVEVYRGSSGKSGGQKQKLTTTCLAAALRYQLGGDNAHGIPTFAPVVMDEAFDKADNTFTRLAMGIFTNFGFQMVVATPLKSVMTLERFIGGAGFVSIHDRKHSGVTLIEYDAERQRLNLPERAAKAIRAAEAEAAVEAA